MSQDWFVDVYQSDTKSAHDIMTQIELMLETLKSSFAGAAYAPDPMGGMPCHRPLGRRIRNYPNTAWLSSLMGDVNQRMWVYRNDTCEGWLIDATIADVVLGVRGGTLAYNVNGGNLAGSWTISGVTVDPHTHNVSNHVHQWYDRTGSGDDRTFNAGGGATALAGGGKQGLEISVNTGDTTSGIDMDCYTSPSGAQTSSTQNTNTTSSSAIWRPRAAVGTVQYPDLT